MLLLFALVCILAANRHNSGLFGQTSSTHGSLRVSVLDPTGAAIPDANVEVRLTKRNWTRSARTCRDGGAYLADLPPGEYTVQVDASNFESQVTQVEILLGHETSLRLMLDLATMTEQVTVIAAAASSVDSLTIPVQTHVGALEIQGLPINQRSFLDFALLDSALQRDSLRVHAVAVTSGFNVTGQRPRSNSLQMDGADLNDETTGGVRGSVPLEAIQEFQVLTSGYQAEYGRASGGVVNVVTKNGGNAVHGSLFGFLRHRSLDATNSFSPTANPPYTRTQYGGSLSGPLRRDKTFVFVSLEQLRRQESGFSRIGLAPDTFTLTRAQQELKALDSSHPAVVSAERGLAIARTGIDPETGMAPLYGVTPLEGLGGVYPVTQRMGAYMLRLDHEVSQTHSLAARFNYAHDQVSAFEAQNNDQIAGLLSFGRTAALNTVDPTAVVSMSSVLNPRTLNDFRFFWGSRKFEMTPNCFEPPVNIPAAAFLGRESILPHYRTERHIHLNDALTFSLGRHTMKLGGDFMLCPTTVEYHRLMHGQFVFGPQPAPGAPAGSPVLSAVQAYGLGLASNFVQQFGDPSASAGKTSLGLFIQDSWRLSPRLTTDIGLRYDREAPDILEPSDPSFGRLFSELSIRRSPPADTDNIQPRVGLACQLVGDGRLTLRASYGIFYDRLLNLATYLARTGDGGQLRRIILQGPSAADVYQSLAQELTEYPASSQPSGLIAFSDRWRLGRSQQGNLVLAAELTSGLSMDIGYLWSQGTHLARSRDYNPTDSLQAAAFLSTGGSFAELSTRNFFRPYAEVSEVMVFEPSASSTFHGLRLKLDGRLGPHTTVRASYTFSKAIDDAEEIFPHSRAQDMKNLSAERGLALYDQRHRFVLNGFFDFGTPFPARSLSGALLNDWSLASMIEIASGRPFNVLLGFDNNLDQDPGADRPDLVLPDLSDQAVADGVFAVPSAGQSGNLGRNSFVGPGFASFGLRIQKAVGLGASWTCQIIAEGFNLLNRSNIRTVNPNYLRAGEPLTAFDPRQIQVGVRLTF